MARVIIVGAGASGILAALKASENHEVFLIDRNDRVCKKILVTGNGHCNYWNEQVSSKYYETDDFSNLEAILTKDNIKNTYNFLENLGLYPMKKGDYYYPYSNQAVCVREIFERQLKKRNVKFIANFYVTSAKKENDSFIVSDGEREIIGDKLILATGSKAMPKTGSDGSGYLLAASFSHPINTVYPALTPLISNEKWMRDWENIRVNAKLDLHVNNKLVKEDEGEVQLTNNGISGICAFNLSGLAIKNISLNNKVSVIIHFLPQLEDDFISFFDKRNEMLDNPTLEEAFESILPYKLTFVLLEKSHLKKEQRWQELTDSEKHCLMNVLFHLEIPIVDVSQFLRAQVCTGGVSLTTINPKSMESNIVKGLYFTGELLDVNGNCGGFNLAFAFITGFIAGGLE